MQTDAFTLRARNDSDKVWICDLLKSQWGSTEIVTRGVLHDGSMLPGYVALVDGRPAGLLTYRIIGDKCEIITLNSLQRSLGIGTALIQAVRKRAVEAKCKRLWLITTNDNLAAIRFYQRRGFLLVTIHRNAIKFSRMLKPSIPETGCDDIPIRDEIELEMVL